MADEMDAVSEPKRTPVSFWVFCAVVVAAVTGLVLGVTGAFDEDEPAPGSIDEILARPVTVPPAPREVRFCWNGSKGSVDVSWMLDGNYEQVDGRENNQCIDITGTRPGDYLSFSVQASSRRSMDVSCRILVDGTAVERAESSGRYVIASCSGRV